MRWTVTVRDSMGRVTAVQNYAGASPGAGLSIAPNVTLTPNSPWGSNTTTDGVAQAAYNVQNVSGCPSLTIAVQATDEAGNTHSNCFDGLGRLIAVVERPVPDPGGGTISHSTSYAYDVLDDLVSVNMGSLVAAFPVFAGTPDDGVPTRNQRRLPAPARYLRPAASTPTPMTSPAIRSPTPMPAAS